jgi:hypothetical protein
MTGRFLKLQQAQRIAEQHLAIVGQRDAWVTTGLMPRSKLDAGQPVKWVWRIRDFR